VHAARIESVDDPRLEAFRYVSDSAELGRRGLIVIEGRLVVERLLTAATVPAEALLLTEGAERAMAAILARYDAEVEVLVVPLAWMKTITGFNLHRGCLAIARRPPKRSLEELLASGARRLVVLEGVGNPDNVGGLFRTASAFEVDAVVLGPACADPLYRKAIRVSCGAALTVPFAHDPAWPDGLDAIRRQGIEVVALAPHSRYPSIDGIAAGRSRARGVAVLVGAEGPGLTEAALARADVAVRIPIDPRSDSLNVTVAAGIALHMLR
jgi:tRNA G18 (ribose-2'-O)-methylase SpoU